MRADPKWLTNLVASLVRHPRQSNGRGALWRLQWPPATAELDVFLAGQPVPRGGPPRERPRGGRVSLLPALQFSLHHARCNVHGKPVRIGECR